VVEITDRKTFGNAALQVVEPSQQNEYPARGIFDAGTDWAELRLPGLHPK